MRAGRDGGWAVSYVVEVNQAAVHFTGQGAEWWQMWRYWYRDSDRITDLPSFVPGGGIALVACDDREGADWLAGHMVAFGGLPKTAVKVKAVSA